MSMDCAVAVTMAPMDSASRVSLPMPTSEMSAENLTTGSLWWDGARVGVCVGWHVVGLMVLGERVVGRCEGV